MVKINKCLPLKKKKKKAYLSSIPKTPTITYLLSYHFNTLTIIES